MANTPTCLDKLKKMQHAGKRIVFTNGCYDLIHAGHVRFLKEAKKKGDVLVLGLNSDDSIRRLKGPQRPILQYVERYEILSALNCVDFVIPFEEDTPMALIQMVKPDVLIKGGDWKVSDIVGADFVQAHGGEVISGIYLEGRSTTAIIQSIVDSYGSQ